MARLQLWRFLLLPGSLWPRVVAPDRVQSMDQVEQTVCKQMADVKLRLLHRNTGNHLTVCKNVFTNHISLIYTYKDRSSQLELQNTPTTPLQRGKTPPSHEASCWSWVATFKLLGRNPGSRAVIDPATEWSMACNTTLWSLLGLTGRQIGPIRSIGWCSHALAHIKILLFWSYISIHSCGIFSSTLWLYMLEGRGWGSVVLRRKKLKTVVGLQRHKTPNLAEALNLNTIMLVMYPCLSQGEWVSSLVNSQYKSGSVGEHRNSE